MSTVEKLTPERIEELAKEIREFLLEHRVIQKLVSITTMIGSICLRKKIRTQECILNM